MATQDNLGSALCKHEHQTAFDTANCGTAHSRRVSLSNSYVPFVVATNSGRTLSRADVELAYDEQFEVHKANVHLAQEAKTARKTLDLLHRLHGSSVSSAQRVTGKTCQSG